MSGNMVNERTQSQPLSIPVCCPVVELRRYTLYPGQRETLIALFDREFIETQEAVGTRVIAQFRDIDRPDVFTWLRGFPDMAARARALRAFYEGPVWAAHRDAANRTMITFDNVRLLRPTGPKSGFMLDGAARPGRDATVGGPELIVCSICTLTAPAAAGFAKEFEWRIVPVLASHGVRPFAVFETEPSANTFPRLPVREGEHAFVWFTRFADVVTYERHASALEGSREWRESVRPILDRHLRAPMEIWRLTATARSHRLG